MLPMHVLPSGGQNVEICTRFPEIQCFFFGQMRITPFSGAPILNAAGHRMCVWHVPAYAAAQLCFKSSALRSRQCGR